MQTARVRANGKAGFGVRNIDLRDQHRGLKERHRVKFYNHFVHTAGGRHHLSSGLCNY